MHKYSLAHLTQEAVLSGVKAHLGRERENLAMVLAHIGEIEAQEYYKPAGYPSVHMYCVRELHLSKDAAFKRITAARLARTFPAIFEKVAAGALRLSALNILAAHLKPENADELLQACAFRSDFEVREILAERSPQAPVPTTIEPIVEQPMLAAPAESVGQHGELAAQRVQKDVTPLQLKPLGRALYKATLTMPRSMRDKLREAKDLLGYRKEMPDEAEILESGLDLYLAWLKKQKFGSPDRPRAARRGKDPAYISPTVRRQVHERDGGRCTFVSDTGVRCPETRGLEDDHIVPIAQGGTSEPSNLRLRCRAHNQLEAERTFGKAFMDHKRALAKAAAQRRRCAAKRTPEQAAREDQQIIDWLSVFRYSIEEARWALQQVRPEDFPLFGYRRDRCLRVLQQRVQTRSA